MVRNTLHGLENKRGTKHWIFFTVNRTWLHDYVRSNIIVSSSVSNVNNVSKKLVGYLFKWTIINLSILYALKVEYCDGTYFVCEEL